MESILSRIAEHLRNDYAIERDLAMFLRDCTETQIADLPEQFIAAVGDIGTLHPSREAIIGFFNRRLDWALCRCTDDELDRIYASEEFDAFMDDFVQDQ